MQKYFCTYIEQIVLKKDLLYLQTPWYRNPFSLWLHVLRTVRRVSWRRKLRNRSLGSEKTLQKLIYILFKFVEMFYDNFNVTLDLLETDLWGTPNAPSRYVTVYTRKVCRTSIQLYLNDDRSRHLRILFRELPRAERLPYRSRKLLCNWSELD